VSFNTYTRDVEFYKGRTKRLNFLRLKVGGLEVMTKMETLFLKEIFKIKIYFKYTTTFFRGLFVNIFLLESLFIFLVFSRASYEESLSVLKNETFCSALLKLNNKSHLYIY